jgi:hypothetical protein
MWKNRNNKLGFHLHSQQIRKRIEKCSLLAALKGYLLAA